MSNTVEVQARNLHLNENLEEYINKKAGKLDHYLPAIEEVRVELEHFKSARSATDRNSAQITARGKGLILRTEQRADEIHVAFDAALDHMQRQIDRYKGKHYHGRGDGRSAADISPATEPAPDDEGPGVVVRTKKFAVLPMTPEEAVEQMRYLGHDNFFIFFNPEANALQVMYRRHDGTYGLIEPTVG